MKTNIKYLFTVSLLSSLMFFSCEDTHVGDDEELNYNTNINVVEFSAPTANATAVADGEVKLYRSRILVNGPSVANLNDDVVVTFSVDESSSAIEDVNYFLETNSITLEKSNNYLANIPVSIITQDVVAPSTQTLVLNIDSISTSHDNVVISGNRQQVIITINYSCYADLAGTYTATNNFCNPVGFTIEITPNEDGSWHLSDANGYWLWDCTGNDGLANDGNIFIVCGEVLPSTDLTYGTGGGSYTIGDITGGSWDEETGTLILYNQDTFFSGGPYNWTSIYVKQ